MPYKLVQEKSRKFEKMWNFNLERLPELTNAAQETI